MPKVTPAYHALSERLPIYPPRFSPPSVLLLSPPRSLLSLSLPLSMDRPYSSFFFPLLSLFSFTSRRRLTVVPCFFYRLAPVLRAIQPTLYEKTLKSFFATGRASWLLLQPETAATVSSDAIRKLGENASIYACNVYIYIHERKLRDTRSPQSCQIRSSPLSFYTIRFLGRFHSHFLFVRYEEGRRGANYSDLSRSNAKVD